MPPRISVSRWEICQLCNFFLPRNLYLRKSFRRQPQRNLTSCTTFTAVRSSTTARRGYAREAAPPNRVEPSSKLEASNRSGHKFSEAELEEAWQSLKRLCDRFLTLPRVPSEKETLLVLNQCSVMAQVLIRDRRTDVIDRKDGAAFALLDLDDSGAKKTISTNKLSAAVLRTKKDISRAAYAVVKDPTVFISPEILARYVKLQADLGMPDTFPEVFHMYANKLIPIKGDPILYLRQKPNRITNAVKKTVADRALQTAINARQLNTAMDIVDCTYNTKAFLRSKLVTKCLMPGMALTSLPLAAYVAATELAGWQNTMEPEMATNVAFAGILAYIVFTGTIGVVATTTANDQMERVTWADGMPLRQRWMREDERAAVDRIAVAWGFRETWRRGEEEGEEWDTLREWIGMKGMILDRISLMEGME